MSAALTSDELIASIKRRASIPENQATFSKQDLLDFANEELQLGVVPLIMSLHEDFLLFEDELEYITDTKEYAIPSRAMGNKLRDVQHKVSEDTYAELTRVGIGERFSEYDISTSTSLRKYYIKNNKVVFVGTVGPNPSSTNRLVMVYYIRPAQMVLEEKVGVISDINRTTGEVSLTEVPEDFSTSILYDFYKAGSPHSVLDKDLTATNINVNARTVTFTPADIPASLSVGDHLSKAEEAIIPQVPSELHVMLAQMVACRVLESMGDTQGLQNALIKLKQMETAAGTIIDNRVDDAPQKVVNQHGAVRTSVFSKRFNRR